MEAKLEKYVNDEFDKNLLPAIMRTSLLFRFCL